jgi:hypothetical protein
MPPFAERFVPPGIRRRPVLVQGVRSAVLIPVGMTGLSQWNNRASGYLQVEPAYERPVSGLGADDPSKLTDAELAAVQAAVKKFVASGMPESEARVRAVRIFVRVRQERPRAMPHDQGLHRGWKRGRHRGWATGATRPPGWRRRGAGPTGLSGLGPSAPVSTAADFAKLNAAQNHAIAVQAEISSIGKDAWNSEILEQTDTFESAGWSPASDYDYDHMMSFWLAQSKRLLVHGSEWLEYGPTPADVAEIESFAKGSDRLIQLLKTFLPPSTASQAASDRAAIEAQLSKVQVKSPSDEASKAFKEELQKRVNNLADSGLKTVATAAGVIAVAAIGAKAIGII